MSDQLARHLEYCPAGSPNGRSPLGNCQDSWTRPAPPGQMGHAWHRRGIPLASWSSHPKLPSPLPLREPLWTEIRFLDQPKPTPTRSRVPRCQVFWGPMWLWRWAAQCPSTTSFGFLWLPEQPGACLVSQMTWLEMWGQPCCARDVSRCSEATGCLPLSCRQSYGWTPRRSQPTFAAVPTWVTLSWNTHGWRLVCSLLLRHSWPERELSFWICNNRPG